MQKGRTLSLLEISGSSPILPLQEEWSLAVLGAPLLPLNVQGLGVRPSNPLSCVHGHTDIPPPSFFKGRACHMSSLAE
jgi:hypothetical protein